MGATRAPLNGDVLYDPKLLHDLDWASVNYSLSPFITSEKPGESWMVVRPLEKQDFSRGYVKLLSQLTSVGNVSQTDFERQFQSMQKAGCYYITVIEDTRKNEIIGAATLVTELKVIHSCGLRGRLEDVVVNSTYRGKQLGKLIVLTVTLLSKKLGCYKMTLDCKDNLIPFYKAIGYKLEPGNSNSMTVRYEEKPAPTNPS